MRSEPRRGGPAGVLLIVLAALVPTVFAGWLVWRSVDDPKEPAASALSPSGSSSGTTQQAGGVPLGSTGDEQSSSPSGTGEDGGNGKKNDKGRQTPKDGGDGDDAADKGTSGGARPLAGKVVVLDPGHNINNGRHTAEINKLVTAGPFRKECDTTGTATNSGYPEASFTMDVARRAREILREQGATVKLTHDGNRAWGPCVDERARIGNDAHADASVSIHADGSAPGNHGFHVILPGTVVGGGADTTAITGPSRRLGDQVKKHFAESTSSPLSNYLGGGTGLTVRKDLGGLNLSTVPKVFIECGNMRDAAEAAKLTNAGWRQRAAEGIAEGVAAFLVSGS